MNRILVTGGCGFIGSNFVRLALRRLPGARIVNLDKITYAGNPANLAELEREPRYRFVRGDVCDGPLLGRLFEQEGIDAVVHFAAESHVDRSIEGPGEFVRTNVVGTFTLLEAARNAWREDRFQVPGSTSRVDASRSELGDRARASCAPRSEPVPGATRDSERRFLHVSTDEVYGSLGPEGAFVETTAYSPRSPYSASKASSDHLVRAYHHTYGLPVLVTNCSNNYGPYQFPEKLIPLTINNARIGRSLPVYGDGKNVRDWLHVEDHCEALLQVLERGTLGETYNVGGNSERENLAVVETICDALDEKLGRLASGEPRRSLVTFVRDRPGHDRRYAIDASKIRRELGWEPKVSFEEGIRATVEWYLEHGDWLESVLDGSYREYYERMYKGREE